MRGLIGLVIGMGVLILLASSALVLLVLQRADNETRQSNTPITLHEAQGSKLLSASSDGKVLTLILSSPGGEEIEVRDMSSGALLRQFHLTSGN